MGFCAFFNQQLQKKLSSTNSPLLSPLNAHLSQTIPISPYNSVTAITINIWATLELALLLKIWVFYLTLEALSSGFQCILVQAAKALNTITLPHLQHTTIPKALCQSATLTELKSTDPMDHKLLCFPIVQSTSEQGYFS